MSVWFWTLARSVRFLLVWNKIFCDAPNISSTVVNIYQMGRGGWGTIFCIIGRLLSVCLIVTQTCRDGRESYKWAMPPTYDIWWLYKFRSTRKTKYKSLWKKIYFSVLLPLTLERDRCWEYGMSGIVWKLQRVHFCLPLHRN